MFDQVEPTLLIYTVWSAIDLVPSWTKKINPRASDNRPTNRRTKRIMAFYAQRKKYASPGYRLPRSRAPFNRLGRPAAGDEPRPPPAPRRRRAGRRILRILLACLERWAFDPLPLALRPAAKGFIKGLRCLQKTMAAARDRHSPTRK